MFTPFVQLFYFALLKKVAMCLVDKWIYFPLSSYSIGPCQNATIILRNEWPGRVKKKKKEKKKKKAKKDRVNKDLL